MLAGSQAVTWTLTLLWTLIVPRLLGPTEMGRLTTAFAVTGVLGVLLGQGTKNYLVREMVARPERGPDLLGAALVFRASVLPLFVAGILVYARFAHFGSDGAWVLYLATAATFLTLLAEPAQAVFQAVERMEYLAYTSVIDQAIQCAFGIGLAVLGFGAKGLIGCALVSAGLLLILKIHWARPQMRINLRTSPRAIRSMLTESLAYWAFGVFFMIYLWIDSVILSLMAKPDVVGWYGVATKLFTTLMFVPVILSTAWLPRLVSAFEEGRDRLRDASRAPVEVVVILSLPICVAAAMTAGPVIRLLYGESYRNAGPVMAILALVIPFMYLNIMLNQVLIAARRQAQWTWVMAGATVVNPILNLILIHVCETRYHNGAIGAAIALLLTEALIVGVGMAIVGREVLCRSSVWRWVRAGAAALGMWAVMYLSRPLGIFVSAGLGAITFASLGLLLRVASAEEISATRASAARLYRSGARLVSGRGQR
jgi:O-antigen/teichoic acid export membrane protein